MLAMVSNRTYGLNSDAGETMQPQPFRSSATAPGRSSRSSPRPPPPRWEWASTPSSSAEPVRGQGGWAVAAPRGCPRDTWCVQNHNGSAYRSPMSVTDALATSPNTAFAKLISQIGVQRTVDMAVKLGLRSLRGAGHRAVLRPRQQREPG